MFNDLLDFVKISLDNLISNIEEAEKFCSDQKEQDWIDGDRAEYEVLKKQFIEIKKLVQDRSKTNE